MDAWAAVQRQGVDTWQRTLVEIDRLLMGVGNASLVARTQQRINVLGSFVQLFVGLDHSFQRSGVGSAPSWIRRLALV